MIPIHENDWLSDSIDDINDVNLVFVWYAPIMSKVSSEYREPIEDGTGVLAIGEFSVSNTITLTFSSTENKKGGFKLVGISEPSNIDIQSDLGSLCIHTYIDHTMTLFISCQNLSGGLSVTLDNVKEI
jgi:hypothetical protein